MSKTIQQALKPIVIECFNDCFGFNKKKEIEYEDELVDYVIEKFRQSDYWKNNFPQNIDDNDINYVMLKILIKTVVTGMLEKVMSFGNIDDVIDIVNMLNMAKESTNQILKTKK